MAIKWAKTVSLVLQVGSVAALVIISARILSNSGEVNFWIIENFPLKAAWVGLFALTLAHVFTGLFFIRALKDLRRNRSLPEQEAAREDLLVEAGGYVSVLVPRLPTAGKRLVRMSLSDSSTWVAHGGAIAAIVAALPWWWEGGLRWPDWASTLAIAGVTLLLILVNWLIGGAWAIAMSKLGTTMPTSGASSATLLTAVSALGGVISVSFGLLATISGAAIVGTLSWLAHLLIFD